MIDLILILAIAGYSIFLIRKAYRNAKKGKPPGCAGCSGTCGSCPGCVSDTKKTEEKGTVKSK